MKIFPPINVVHEKDNYDSSLNESEATILYPNQTSGFSVEVLDLCVDSKHTDKVLRNLVLNLNSD
jgi:hypothetical protein